MTDRNKRAQGKDIKRWTKKVRPLLSLKRQSTSFALTILFFMCGILSANVGEKKFKEFTHEAWMTYPSHRITMIENLLEKYEIDGQNRKTIEVLLGNPDKVCEDGTYFYDSMHGNGVYVEFKNDTVSDIYYIA